MAAHKTRLNDEQFSLIRKALGDPKRFEILEKLGQAKELASCTCVRDWTGLAPATITHHLQELESAGLIHIERSGKYAQISVRREVWQAYLARLSEVLG